MTESEQKFVHFIDYENVHKHIPMDEIAKGKNQQVILFVGNQQKIPNEWLRVDYNVTTIRVGRTAKDNLDFHLAAYLGMIHVSRPMEVKFIIWSGDTGFDDLIEHLKMRKRSIERKDPRPLKKKKIPEFDLVLSQNNSSPTIKEVGERVVEILSKSNNRLRPRKKLTLENQIENWRTGIGFTHTPKQVFNWLKQKEHIIDNDNEQIQYNF